jgi:hypothetical protein
VTKVFGTVRLAGGGSAADATVEVHNASGDVVDQIRTTGDGAFTYYLSPGKWTFKTYDTRGHRGSEEVVLTEDDATVGVDLEIG